MKIEDNQAKDLFAKEKVHFILSHSYLVFLVAVILGVIFDLIMPINIISGRQIQYFGLAMMVISSILIYWSQLSSSNFKTKKTNNSSYFERGPYKYTRHPTHLGLFVLTIGFSLVINSPFSIIFSFLSYIITILFFLKKEEKLLQKKYGEKYQNYKKRTKNWI